MEEQMCGICTENFNDLHPSCNVLTRNCNKHLYHNKCILDWYRVIMESNTIRAACPLCANDKIPFEERMFWNVLRKYQYETGIIKESHDYPFRLDTIPTEQSSIVVNQNRLFEMVRNKELVEGSKIIEYEANRMQNSYHVHYDGPKMYKYLRTCYYDGFNFTESYITGIRDDYLVPASIGPIIKSLMTNNMYVVIISDDDKEHKYWVYIWYSILVLCLFIICLVL